MCYINTLGRNPGAVVKACLLGKSEIADSNASLAFKFQRKFQRNIRHRHNRLMKELYYDHKLLRY